MTKMAIAGILLALVVTPRRDNYVDRLVDMAGAPYSELTCSAYICKAKRLAPCSALSMYSGCDGKLEIVAQYPDRSMIDQTLLQPGDVADFNGIHVAAYIGGGVGMDSDIEHGGVGPINLWTEPLSDPWFSGRVRILRWNEEGIKPPPLALSLPPEPDSLDPSNP